MSIMRSLVCLACLVQVVVVLAQDTEITRVRPLSDEDRRRPPPYERTRSIYLVNLVPVPRDHATDPRTNSVSPTDESTRGRNPTLFLLQKVDDGDNLPDGIYYRPAPGETETPKPAFVQDLTDVQSYVLARGNVRHPGRQ